MKYPKMREIPTTRELVDVFKGYNHNLRIGDGEFYDMTNLSSDNYPVLSPRSPRGTYRTGAVPNGIIAKDVLCWVDETNFVIGAKDGSNDATVIAMGLEDSPKTLVSMGSYVIILPDKKYVNTIPDSNGEYEYGKIEASFTTSIDDKPIRPCDKDGVVIDNISVGSHMPTSPVDKQYWFDTSVIPHTLKKYYASSEDWVAASDTYIRIDFKDIGVNFAVGDIVTLSGFSYNEQLKALNKTAQKIIARDNDYIAFTGLFTTVEATPDDQVTIERRMPNMDFIIESGNRLWGCRYGEAINKEFVNEIYASVLGDFKNWTAFEGVSTDAYVASVGTDGPFTGAVAYLGYPMFFKENCIHKVYGNYPSNYQIQTTECRGVEQGSSKSLAIVNEVLYYKSRSAVCAYDGSLPVEISSYLGDVSYGDAVAGAIGSKYYISMRETKADTTDKYNLFVYDSAKGMWHREDGTQVEDFCNYQGDLYYIDHQDNNIKTVKGSQGVLESKPIKWTATTGVIGTDSPDKKYISRMDVRMSLEVGARVAFYAEYDSSGEWEYLFTMTGTRLGSFPVPIRPQRCDHMRLKIIGEGRANIYSICKTIEQGSDV